MRAVTAAALLAGVAVAAGRAGGSGPAGPTLGPSDRTALSPSGGRPPRARPQSVAEVPVFATVDAEGPTAFTLRGELTPARKKAVEQRTRLVVADVARRFPPAATSPKRGVDVCVFENPADYRAFADDVAGTRPSELGFYLPWKRLVVVNLKYGLRNLSHELVHPLVGDDFPAIPSWMNEGLGSLYGGSDVTPKGLRFTVNYRVRDVQAALKAGRLPSLAQLARAGGDDVYGDDAMVWYGLARHALLRLAAEGKLSDFYLAMRGGADPESALTSRLDDAAFATWAARQKVGTRVAEP